MKNGRGKPGYFGGREEKTPVDLPPVAENSDLCSMLSMLISAHESTVKELKHVRTDWRTARTKLGGDPIDSIADAVAISQEVDQEAIEFFREEATKRRNEAKGG